MSNFLTLSPLTGGLLGTAPRVHSASTNDTEAVATASGYVADMVAAGKMAVLDVVFLNYDVDGTAGGGMYHVTATGGGTLVTYVP